MDTRPGAPERKEIRIFAITIRSNANKALRSVKMSVNETQKSVSWAPAAQHAFKATFTPPLDISVSDSLNLELHSSWMQIGTFSTSEKLVQISAEQLLHNNTDEGGQREWNQTFGKVEVTVLLSHETSLNRQGPAESTSASSDENTQLVPTTEDILRDCPRFRVLLIGKCGVGKSSLINKAFGVDDALVSDAAPGQAEIDKEILSGENPRFVLHDSRGFEPGETSNFNVVCDFIRARNQKSELKDRLHAIWVCTATPTSGSRVLETGVEELFQLKNNGDLGSVPMIAVFTKFDALVAREDRELDSPEYEDKSEEELSKLARQRADRAFEEECSKPFEAGSGVQIPHIAVSTKKGYETMLNDLIQITFEHVQRHVSIPVSIVAAIAQKPNSMVKIEGCIAVGKLRYWRGLASSINFPKKTLAACLDVVHTDIVKVWRLDDQQQNLNSKEFKALMSNLVSDNIKREFSAPPHQNFLNNLAMVGNITGVVGGFLGPAASIVIPIAGCLVLAKWAYEVYQASYSNLEHLMAYIIDLTLVMETIFSIAEGKHPVSRRLIKLAFNEYLNSPTKRAVHASIAKHVDQTKILSLGARDAALQEIEKILRRHAIKPEELFKLKDEMAPYLVVSHEDEPWEVK